jgi:hypothetical protein
MSLERSMQTLPEVQARHLLEALVDAWMAGSEREWELRLACASEPGAHRATMTVRGARGPVIELRLHHDLARAANAYEARVHDWPGYLALARKYGTSQACAGVPR